MTRYSSILASIGILAITTVAHAHPGHGAPGDHYSLLHYVTEPLHLGIGLGLFIAAIAFFRLLRTEYLRRRRRESMR